MNALPFAGVLVAVLSVIACRWMAGAKAEDERFTDKHP